MSMRRSGDGVFGGRSGEDVRRCCGDGLKGVDALIAKVEASGLTARRSTNVLHELRVKRVQFNDALVQALGLRVEARRWLGGAECLPFDADSGLHGACDDEGGERGQAADVTVVQVSSRRLEASAGKRADDWVGSGRNG